MFDVETLDTESTAVVISAAITHFEFEDKCSYQEFVNKSCFVKFSIDEQITKYKRTKSEDTLLWWQKQSEIARKVSLVPSEEDLSVVDGIERLRKYINDHGGPNQTFWARGSLDQMSIDSLAKSANLPVLTAYNKWRDTRTAIDLIADTAKDGSCMIRNFNPDLHVIKHIPQNDCALDIMMLLYHV